MLVVRKYADVPLGNIVLVRSERATMEAIIDEPITRLEDENLDIVLDATTGMIVLEKVGPEEGVATFAGLSRHILHISTDATVVDTGKKLESPVFIFTKNEVAGMQQYTPKRKQGTMAMHEGYQIAREDLDVPIMEGALPKCTFAASKPYKEGERMRNIDGSIVVVTSVSDSMAAAAAEAAANASPGREQRATDVVKTFDFNRAFDLMAAGLGIACRFEEWPSYVFATVNSNGWLMIHVEGELPKRMVIDDPRMLVGKCWQFYGLNMDEAKVTTGGFTISVRQVEESRR